MSSDTEKGDEIKSIIIILYALGISIAIYGLLLYLLDQFITPEPGEPLISTTILDTLPIIFVGLSAVILLILNKIMIPRIMEGNTSSEIMPFAIIASVMVEIIGIFGLILGLFDLFVLGQAVRWNVAIGFIGFAFLIQIYLIQYKYTPKLRSLDGINS